MKTIFKIIVALLLAIGVLVTVMLASSNVDPIIHQFGPNPGLTGKFAVNDKLANAQPLLQGVGKGPEDIAVGANGWLFTAYRDGRVVRFNAQGEYQDIANTQGVPLGIRVDNSGQLVIADALRGLLRVSQTGRVTVLAEQVNGERMLFPDALDIASDGTVWFSDASQRFGYHDYVYMFLEGRDTGRLLSYSPDTGQVTVALEGLSFANGVAVAPDDSYVLVSETTAGRVRRFWLTGPNAGSDDYFVEDLPGTPDNLSIDDQGLVWVALAGIRDSNIESLSSNIFLRKLLGAIPPNWLVPKNTHAFLLAFDANGKLVHNLHDVNSRFHPSTGARRVDNTLYITNLSSDAIGVFELDD